MKQFSIEKRLDTSFDDALARIPEALKSQGFGVLTEIDVQSTLKQKLGVDFRRYKILGACNPPFAHEALKTDLGIGVMLPCNVAVYEDDEGHTVVRAIDPTATLAAAGNDKLKALAEDVKERLVNALAALG